MTASAGYVLSMTVGGSCPAGSWSGAVYTTAAIVADCTVMFSATPTTYEVTPSGDNGETFLPGAPQTVPGGGTQSFTVMPASGFTLLTAVGGTCAAGSWSGSVYTTGAITSDCTVVFSATANVTYVITASGDLAETISPALASDVSPGATQSFTVTADTGYSLSTAVGGSCPPGSWSGAVYTTGAISADCSVTFSATPLTYQVAATGDSGESFSPNTAQTVPYGSTQSFTVAANPGYMLSMIVGGSCTAGGWSAGVYTTGPIVSNCTVAFSATPYTFQVTAIGDSWEFISPDTAQTVSYGATQSFSVTADTGYTLSTMVGGTCPAGNWSGGVYTTGPIVANCGVTFSASPSTFAVTATGDSWETFSPLAVQTISYGGSASFTVTADPDYTVSTTVGGTCPTGTWSGAVYTVGPIVSACTVVFGAALDTFQVSAIGDSWETISPAAAQTVTYGDTTALTVTPITGYTLSTTVGGTCPPGSWAAGTYTTGSIVADCTVTFSATPSVYQVTAAGDAREVISPNTAQTAGYGGTVAFNVTADTGDTLSPTVGGTCPPGIWTGAVYSTGALTSNCTLVFSAAPSVFQVSASGDARESVSPQTPQAVTYGGTQAFTVTPNADYAVATAVGGSCPAGTWSGDIYTTGPIVSSCAVTFSAALSTYHVTISGDSWESISPSVPQTVTYGAVLAVTVNALTGYTLSTTVSGTCPAGTWSGDVYTTAAITSNCTLMFSAAPSVFQIGTSGDGAESVSPSFAASVSYGATQAFTVTADGGYALSTTVGGNCPAGSWVGDVYTTGPITADCNLSFSAMSSTWQVTAAGDTHESISPATPQTVNAGSSLAYTVNAHSGFTLSTTVGGTCPAGTWAGAVYTMGSIIADCSVTFSATQTTYQVTPSGAVGETVSPDTAQTVDSGSTLAFTVTAHTGYGLSTTVGGSCPAGTWSGSVYTTGPIVSSCTVTFTDTADTYQVTASGDSRETISPSTAQTVSYGDTLTFGVTPNTGDTVSATVGGTCPAGSWSGAVYTTGIITSSCTVSFSAATSVYQVTPSGDSRESISPSTAQPVSYGGTLALTVTANAHNTLSSVVGGTCPAGSWSGSVYTTGAIVSDCSVTFSANPNTYQVAATGDAWESISPGTAQTVSYGGTQAFTVTASTGYTLSQTAGGTCPAGSWSGSIYTTGGITANCSVIFSATPSTFQVTVSGDAWESISPNTPQNVGYDGTLAFTVNADTGYTLSLAVAGTCPVGNWSGDVYTTGTITASCSVTFSAAQDTYQITTSGDGFESVSPSLAPSVSYGATQAFSVAVDAGYTLSSTVGGTCPPGTWVGDIYTTGAVFSSCSVSFSATANTNPVTASGDSHESISPSTSQMVISGGTATFTVTAHANYTLSTTVGGTCPAGFWSAGVYTTGAIVAGCNVTFSAALDAYQVSVSGDGEESVAPNTAQTVSYGGTQAFTVNADTGYTLSLTVGGTCPTGGWAGDVYTTGTIVANCTVSFAAALNSYQVTVSGDAHETITPSAAQTVSYGARQAFTVSASTGYTVSSIAGGTCPEGTWAGDVYTTGPIVAACDVTFGATLNTYQVTASGDSRETISPATAQTVSSGGTQSFTVTANTGSTLSLTVGGTCPAGSWSGAVYTTGAIVADCAVVFSAPVNTYVVTGSGDSHESISPGGAQVVDYGATQALTITANNGYTLSPTVGGSCPAGSWSGNVYTTGIITSSCSVTFSATAGSATYQVSTSGDGAEAISPSFASGLSSGATQAFTVTASPGYTLSLVVGGSCPAGSWSGDVYTTGPITSDCNVAFASTANTYQVTPSGDSWESISPSTVQLVASGNTQAFTVTADADYTLSPTVGGTCPAGGWSGGVYTTGPIVADCTVTLSAALDTYQVSSSGDGRETLSPDTAQTVGAGDTLAFTVTPATDYTVSTTVAGDCPAGSWSGDVYTTGPIVADCSVAFSAALTTYQVSASGDSREVISPASAQTVSYGSTQSFTVTPDTGYSLSTSVGGTCPAGAWSGSVYTTGPVASNCTVTFSASALVYQVTPSGDTFESISPGTVQSVSYGHQKAFTVNAVTGYTLSASVGGTCPSGTWSGSVYTTGAINSSCTVTFSATPRTFQVTPSGDSDETFTPGSAQPVSYGTTQAFTVTANSGYALSPTVGGTCPAGTWSGNVYTTGPIVASCGVVFGAVVSYQVTPGGDSLETFDPGVAQSVGSGSAAAFTVTPDSGYAVAQTVGGSCPEGSWSGNVYTTGPIQSDCTVFFSTTAATFQVTPSGDSLEVFSPDTVQTVSYGDSLTFTVTPNAGYTLSPTVGGTCPPGPFGPDTYATGAITGDCTVIFSVLPLTCDPCLANVCQNQAGVCSGDAACSSAAPTYASCVSAGVEDAEDCLSDFRGTDPAAFALAGCVAGNVAGIPGSCATACGSELPADLP